jgi:hypothetical protein
LRAAALADAVDHEVIDVLRHSTGDCLARQFWFSDLLPIPRLPACGCFVIRAP